MAWAKTKADDVEIIQTLLNPDHLFNLQVNAQKFIRSEFNIKSTSNKYFDFFHMICQLEIKDATFKNYKKTSIFDSKLSPNILSKLIRKFKSHAFS